MKRFIYLIAIGLFASCSLFGQFSMNLSGAAFTPSTIEVSEMSILEFSYVVPSTSNPIPANTVNIVVEMPTIYYESDGTVPFGTAAGFFDWVLSEGVWTGTNNVELSNSFFDQTSGGIVSLNVVGISESAGQAQATNVNPQEVSFLNPVNGTGTSAAMIVDALLPIDLVSFKGSNNDCAFTELIWQTASETNNEGFFVERSIDGGREFKDIGFVKGSGNSTSNKDYKFTDNIKALGSSKVIYYRLRQIDLDGRNEYSDIIKFNLDCNSRFTMTAFPNPVMSELTVEVEGNLDNVKEIVMMNNLNQVLQNIKLDGNGQVRIDMRAHNAGVYFFKLIGENNEVIESKKIINLGR